MSIFKDYDIAAGSRLFTIGEDQDENPGEDNDQIIPRGQTVGTGGRVLQLMPESVQISRRGRRGRNRRETFEQINQTNTSSASHATRSLTR